MTRMTAAEAAIHVLKLVVVEIILERITNIAMGTDLDGVDGAQDMSH